MQVNSTRLRHAVGNRYEDNQLLRGRILNLNVIVIQEGINGLRGWRLIRSRSSVVPLALCRIFLRTRHKVMWWSFRGQVNHRTCWRRCGSPPRHLRWFTGNVGKNEGATLAPRASEKQSPATFKGCPRRNESAWTWISCNCHGPVEDRQAWHGRGQAHLVKPWQT